MSWFPLARDLMEGEVFRRWTPAERLFYWRLMDEANERGCPFYRSDIWLSVELGIAERTIRKARRKARDAGWLVVIPGRQDARGRGLATQYVEVRWATVERGQSFSRMNRWAFRLIVDLCGRRVIAPADVVVYVTLAYWLGKYRDYYDEERGFFISKRDLRELTGLADAPGRVRRLYEAFTYSDGAHLFEFKDTWQQITITKWATPKPPWDDEANATFWENRLKRIEELVEIERDRRIENLLARVWDTEDAD